MSYWYLGTPYYHTDPEIRKHRFYAVTHALGKLIQEGKIVFSPITHLHMVALANYVDHWKHDDFLAFDDHFFKNADGLYVLELPGWRESKGLTLEIEWAREKNIPIFHIMPAQYIPEANRKILEEFAEQDKILGAPFEMEELTGEEMLD